MILWRIVASSVALCCGYASANLIANSSFEDVPNNNTGLGLLPTNWSSFSGSPSTFSNDGSYGVTPSFGDSFNNVVAQDGQRFVAGSSVEPQEFGQTLTQALVEGERYRMSAWLHRSSRQDLPDDGGFVVSLKTLTDAERVIGFLTPTQTYEWEFRNFDFVAPSDNFSIVKFSPISAGSTGSYVALDNLNLEVVPEPSSLFIMTVAGTLLILRQMKNRDQ